MPHFDGRVCVHLLPLQLAQDRTIVDELIKAPYGGGGAMEVSMEGVRELELLLEMKEKQALVAATGANDAPSTNVTEDEVDNAKVQYAIDGEIDFGPEQDESLAFARKGYRIDHIPEGSYAQIICQLADDPSLLLLGEAREGYSLSLFAIGDWPSDVTEEVPSPLEHILQDVSVSSDRKTIISIVSNKLKVTPRKAKDVVAFFTDSELETNIASTDRLHLSVFPNLEYQQMYKDAWRMLRDYFYDKEMHSIDWYEAFERYLPLVERCAKREELDDGAFHVCVCLRSE